MRWLFLLPLVGCAEPTRVPTYFPPPDPERPDDGELKQTFEARAVMVVVDLSCSMAFDDHVTGMRVGTEELLDILLGYDERIDMFGVSIFASRGAVEGGRGTDDPTEPPWAPLAFASDEADLLTERIAGICDPMNGCADPDLPFPSADEIGTMTNAAIGLEMAMHQLELYTDARWRRVIVLATGGNFNAGGSAQAATSAATRAWEELDIEIWPILILPPGDDDPLAAGMARGGGELLRATGAADIEQAFSTVGDALEPLERPFRPEAR